MASGKVTRPTDVDREKIGLLAWGSRATSVYFTDDTDTLRGHIPHLASSARHITRLASEAIVNDTGDEEVNCILGALEGVELILSFIEALEEVAVKRESGATT